MTTQLPWWRTETYDLDLAVPFEFLNNSGPQGVALVKAWPDGRTDKGWGLVGPKGEEGVGFMPRYLRDEFNSRRVLFGYEADRWAFAFVMRSVKMVCIDIDGKNGGLENAKKLGVLPITLAETSKGGDGFHLFYLVDESWHASKGYGLLSDRIGIVQGVDIRATGCVYHHKQQRWNHQVIAPLPDHLFELLNHREQKLAATEARINAVIDDGDAMGVAMLHDELLSELAKPVAAGKRNVTMFAIGNQLRAAGVPDWEQHLSDRASHIGLDGPEIAHILRNIGRYGPA